ncbi:hypothetical protein HK097_000855, partial [Rhizophlyctis rosea]
MDQTFQEADLDTGDFIVIQRNSDKIKYIDVHQNPALVPSPVDAKTAFHDYFRNIQKHNQNLDVTIRYGPSASFSLRCHSQILSKCLYFNTLFTNTAFKPVSESTLDPTYHPKAVEHIIEYIYLSTIPTTDLDLYVTLSMIKFADFLNMADVVEVLIQSIRPDSLSCVTFCIVIKFGYENLSARGLIDVAVRWTPAINVGLLSSIESVKEFKRENDGAWRLFADAINRRWGTIMY